MILGELRKEPEPDYLLDELLKYILKFQETHTDGFTLEDISNFIDSENTIEYPDYDEDGNEFSKYEFIGDREFTDINYLNIMLQQLYFDDHIKYNTGNSFEDFRYYMTFKGKWFIKKGGYQTELYQKNQEKIRNERFQIIQYILAVGVSTPFLWYLMDILRNYYNPCLEIFVYILPYLLIISFLLLLAYKLNKAYISRYRKLVKRVKRYVRKWRNG